MRFEIAVGGRTRAVTVDRAASAGRYRVTIDGRSHDVEARRTADFGLFLAAGTFPQKVPGTSADKSQGDASLPSEESPDPSKKVPGTFPGKVPAAYEVFVTPGGRAGEVLVTLDGRIAAATVNDRRPGPAADISAHAHGEQRVVAPMPGRVVRLLVAPGDEVTARQGLVVVEAMKMENELRAPRGGRVKEISVAPGASVEAGRVLVVIE